MTDGGEGTPGMVVSNETREKMRQNNLGKKLSEETKNKISNSLKNRKFSEETKNKLRQNHARSKKVLCIETNTTYPSCNEAARQFGKTKRGQGTFIAEASRKGRTAYGFHWKYI